MRVNNWLMLMTLLALGMGVWNFASGQITNRRDGLYSSETVSVDSLSTGGNGTSRVDPALVQGQAAAIRAAKTPVKTAERRERQSAAASTPVKLSWSSLGMTEKAALAGLAVTLVAAVGVAIYALPRRKAKRVQPQVTLLFGVAQENLSARKAVRRENESIPTRRAA